MQHYISQLLADIAFATQNVSLPFIENELGLFDWISDEDEDKMAPVRNLQEWTGISKEMLPPHERLSNDQVHELLVALKKMLEAYNWYFVLQIEVPERIQYAVIRANFNQEAKIKRWHMGFFAVCISGTEHRKCALGEYCQCEMFADLFAGFSSWERSPEEERASELEIEIKHLKRKYDEDWMKYYPYHLDKKYDDENGNPYNYGEGENDEEGEEDENWWRS